MYDWVLNTPLESFAQDASREELVIAPAVECLTTTAWQNYNKLAVSSTPYTLLKTQIFVDVFLIEEYEYATLRKELLIAHFIERLKRNDLGKPDL